MDTRSEVSAQYVPSLESMDDFRKNIFNTENPVLIDLPEWGQGAAADNEKSEESKVIEEDDEQHSETKENLRKTMKELRDQIQEMILENENAPDDERLELWEFNLDVEKQRRQEVMMEQEATRVRKEMEQENLAKCYLRDVKKECWDSMKVKGKVVKAFHSEQEVMNYPLNERTEKAMEDLDRVQNTRQLEMAACTQSSLKETSSAKEEEHEEEDHEAESDALKGSFSAELACSNPAVYNQFSLHTTEQKINQIILLQDVIHRIKIAFNGDFEAVHKQKVQELKRVRDRNKHVREIMLKLDMMEELWEPSLTAGEQPETLFTVDDSEIKAEKYLTPEEKKEEERKKLEEQKRLASKSNDVKGRALDGMMDGVLEVKEEDILKMEIPPPEFVLTKPDIQWSDEEIKVYKEYEKKTKDLSEEKEKYKKLMESEMKKLQASTRDATQRFDKTLAKLFEKKMKSEMAICQEELKITYLNNSILVEDEMINRGLELKLQLDKTLAYKDEIGEEVKKREEEVDLFQEAYDSIVAEDKVLDKDFRKEFFDVPRHMVDLLYKLFKRRPRAQKMRTQTDTNSNPFKQQRLSGSLAPDALGKLLKAMEELDDVENIPQDLSPAVWERFCLVRRAKVESEQKIKAKALTLAEMQAFLQKRRDEDNATQQEIKNLSEELESLHKEKNRLLVDIMVQFLLKQDQVEVSTTDMTDIYAAAVLLQRRVVEDLNKTIRTQGEQKLASIAECRDIPKAIIQLQWEKDMMETQRKDLINKERDIQKLKLSEEPKDHLNKTDQDSRMSKQVSTVEKVKALQEKTHPQNVQSRKDKINKLKKKAAMIAEENAVLDQEIPELQASEAERRHIYEATASEENQAAIREEHYQEIIEKKKLDDLATAQTEDLAFLQAEVERLLMKNFPSLHQLKHP